MIGYNFNTIDGVTWRDNQYGVFAISPPLMFSEITETHARRLMKDRNAFFVRWESDFNEVVGSSWWHIINDKASELADFSKKTRYQIRRGLRTYDCEPVSIELILSEGYEVYSAAISRYVTHEVQLSDTDFSEAIRRFPTQTEFWGVREKASGKLVAFSENYVEAGVCFYNTMWFEPAALKQYSSYALFYEMNHHYLKQRGFRYVSDGARSLSHSTQIHEFLESKFGFRKAYACLNVVYTPWLGTAIAAVYPFRGIFEKIPLAVFKKVSILLRQEEIRRECAEIISR